MPELPEVETVRRALSNLIIDKEIKKIDIFYPRIIRTPQDKEHFKLLLTGQKLQSISRKGKYLLFYFTDVLLISHLRMEGKYIYQKKSELTIDKHDHIIFYFTDGSSLKYRDVRKFGTMDVIKLSEEKDFPQLKKLGQEPIDPNFDINLFKQLLVKRQAPIKQALLNQEVISGLGNIYVDDSLALSKINPLKLSNQLTDEEVEILLQSIRALLFKAIEHGGSSIRSFESHRGRGSMQDHLIVYGKEGEPCINCGTPIKKIRVGGRGTHYCPQCQK